MPDMFDARIALFNQHADSQEEALKMLADEFVKCGVVKDSFFEGIITREKNFATGLRLNNFSVAIPHTDPEHVNRTQVGFISLDAPVPFIEMGTEDSEIPVTMMFMLALKEAHEQLEMLMKLMDMFQNDDLMERFSKVDNYDDYYQLIKEAGLSTGEE
ncbi:MAG: PTS sugar transporter subunit IIA [Erysipelotrichaceae bacterium]|nr:PTS sugar transporter subunit IIA [Erysipelotrichaceae bacterium]